LLNKFYLAKLPEYKVITVAYNAAMKAMHDHQNVPPSKSEWNPPGRHILPSEKQLLCGPSQTITVLQKVHFPNPNTNRLMMYSSYSKSNISSRVCYAYVCSNYQKLQPTATVPQFGFINKLFYISLVDRI